MFLDILCSEPVSCSAVAWQPPTMSENPNRSADLLTEACYRTPSGAIAPAGGGIERIEWATAPGEGALEGSRPINVRCDFYSESKI